MSFPDLPLPAKQMLAAEPVRTHHHLWHFVRNEANWTGRPEASRSALRAADWEALDSKTVRGPVSTFWAWPGR